MPGISDEGLKPNQVVATRFVVVDKQLRVAKNGTPFLTVKLANRNGEITGRLWNGAAEAADSIPSRGVVYVEGKSELFREELQLQIRTIRPVALSEVDPTEFLPVCGQEIPALAEKLKKLASGIKRRSLQRLMRHILGDRDLMELFKRAPAAKSMHHAYVGGLLEHSVSVAKLTLRISRHYPELDRDLLIAGAILHDIGKVHEFVYDFYIDYSDAGRLLGHMILGVQIVEEKIKALKAFPEHDALLLKHLILSHHGEAEFGAVKLPMTREAFVLHFADDLDAKMNSLSRILSDTRGEAWTPYQQTFGRFFYRGASPETEEPGEHVPAAEPKGAEGVQLPLWSQDGMRKADDRA